MQGVGSPEKRPQLIPGSEPYPSAGVAPVVPTSPKSARNGRLAVLAERATGPIETVVSSLINQFEVVADDRVRQVSRDRDRQAYIHTRPHARTGT